MDLYCIKEEDYDFDVYSHSMIFIGSYDNMVETWEYLWDTILLCVVLGSKHPHMWQHNNEKSKAYICNPWVGIDGVVRDYAVGKITLDTFSLSGVEDNIDFPDWSYIIPPLVDEFHTENSRNVVRKGYNRHIALRVGEYLRVKYGLLKREVQHSTEDVNEYLRTMTII